MTRIPILAVSALAILLAGTATAATDETSVASAAAEQLSQEEEPEPEAKDDETRPAASDETQPPLAAERRDSFPNLDVYLPEGEFSLRARKLIKNVLFESQIDYEFVDGDISTFLRYKYYASRFTYKIGVFDTLEFPSLDRASLDFDRVRGAFVLFEYPIDYNRRYFGLIQGDFLRFGDIDDVDNDQQNVYVKLGFQFGTPFDERLNAIAGESRGRRTPVLSAYREIGPQKLGIGVGITQSLDVLGSDYDYTKLQAEAIKRFDISRSTFVITRMHIGSLIQKSEVPGRDDREPVERYSAPRYEFLRLGGRDALKGIDNDVRGSDEAHLTAEYFFPIFRNKDYRTYLLHWNNLYGVTYLGAGTFGFSTSDLTDVGDTIIDAGLGVEASLRVRDYDVYLSAIYAHPVVDPLDTGGGEIRFQVRTSR